jgi:hypothetical protein
MCVSRDEKGRLRTRGLRVPAMLGEAGTRGATVRLCIPDTKAQLSLRRFAGFS